MKARVKATGEIVDVRIDYKQDADYIAQNGQLYWQRELDFNNLNIKDEEITNTPDYWTRLEHQYAGMAMQGILSNGEYLRSLMHTKHDDFRADEVVPSIAVRLSHALVEKMKEERK